MATSTVTRQTAYDAVIKKPVPRITTDDYQLDEYNKFEKKIIVAAMTVPTTLHGGEHSHAYLVLTPEEQIRLAGTVQAKVTNPGEDAGIAAGDTHAIVSSKNNRLAAEKNTYHTQEGVEAALRDLIVDNFPEASIMELKDDTFGYANVAPMTSSSISRPTPRPSMSIS